MQAQIQEIIDQTTFKSTKLHFCLMHILRKYNFTYLTFCSINCILKFEIYAEALIEQPRVHCKNAVIHKQSNCDHSKIDKKKQMFRLIRSSDRPSSPSIRPTILPSFRVAINLLNHPAIVHIFDVAFFWFSMF